MADIGSFGLDVGIYGALADPDTILQLAQHAEEAGFESIWLADHVAFPVSFKSKYPYSAKGDFPTRLSDPLMEPVATMGVLVGATKRVRIGTAVLIMPYRNPVLLARMLVTLDNFSGGRIVLGAGVGWLRGGVQRPRHLRFQAARPGHRRIPRDLQGDLRRRQGLLSRRDLRVRSDFLLAGLRAAAAPADPDRRPGRRRAAARRRARQRLAGSDGRPGEAARASGHARAPGKRSRPPVRGPVARLQDVLEHRRSQTQPLRCARARHRLRHRDNGRPQAPVRARLHEDHRALSWQQCRGVDEPDRSLRGPDRSQGVARWSTGWRRGAALIARPAGRQGAGAPCPCSMHRPQRLRFDARHPRPSPWVPTDR